MAMAMPPQRHCSGGALPWRRAAGILLGCPTLVLVICVQAGASQAVQHLTLTATVEPKSALRASTDTLVFTLLPGQTGATATVDYVAAVREKRGTQVVLAAEPGTIDGPGGAADVEAALSLESEWGAGPTAPGVPVTVARWIGAGLRRGRLTFVLRASAPGTYVVPLRMDLTIP